MIKGKVNSKEGFFTLAVILSTMVMFNFYGLEGVLISVIVLLSAACLIYFAWFYKNGPKSIFDKIYLSLYIAIYISNLFLQRKTVILIYTVYFLVAIGYGIYKFFANKDTFNDEVIFYLAIFCGLYSVTGRYVFLNGDNKLKIISIIIAAAVAVILAVLLFIKKIEFERPKFSNKALLILIAVIATAFVTIVTVKNLNYCLDSSKPETYSATVLSKDEIRRTRGADRYYLMLEINDKIYRFKVTSSEYRSVDISDNVDVYLFDGALSQPYFIK